MYFGRRKGTWEVFCLLTKKVSVQEDKQTSLTEFYREEWNWNQQINISNDIMSKLDSTTALPSFQLKHSDENSHRFDFLLEID